MGDIRGPPYWGLSSDPAVAPRQVQPWYGNNACPGWRPKHPNAVNAGSGHYNQIAFALNTGVAWLGWDWNEMHFTPSNPSMNP